MVSTYNDSPKKVHFAAFLTKTINVRGNEAVIFNQVEINQGGGYNLKTGVFTCPKAGTYLISWFFITPSKATKDYWLRLDINGNSNRYAGMNHYSTHQPAFRSHLVVLKKGDRVQVENAFNYVDVNVYGDVNRHTGFSGLYVSA